MGNVIPVPPPVPTPRPNANAPWYQGHSGATNFTRGEAQRFARQLVQSEDYRVSVQERIKSKTLPAAVECMLWYYAYGKPIESVQVKVETEDLSELSLEELQARAREQLRLLEEAQALQDALPTEFKVL